MKGGFEDLVIEYKLATKKVDTYEFANTMRDQYKQLNLLCLDHKVYLQNVLSKIASLDLKVHDPSVRELIQMIAFMHELVDLDKKLLSQSTIFNSVLVDLKANYGLEPLITAYQVESVERVRRELIPRNEFVNKKISLLVSKYFNVSNLEPYSLNLLGSSDSDSWHLTGAIERHM